MTLEEEYELIYQAAFAARIDDDSLERCLKNAIERSASNKTLEILRNLETLHDQLIIAKKTTHDHVVQLGRLLREKSAK
jgi:hypothetical protein